MRTRTLRLLWPTAVFLLVGLIAVGTALAAGVPPGTVRLASWVTLPRRARATASTR